MHLIKNTDNDNSDTEKEEAESHHVKAKTLERHILMIVKLKHYKMVHFSELFLNTAHKMSVPQFRFFLEGMENNGILYKEVRSTENYSPVSSLYYCLNF
jgi:hypothetical protein